MRSSYGFVEGDFGGCTWLHYYSTGFVTENTIAMNMVSVGEYSELEGAYWPAAAFPKACSLEESKGLAAISMDLEIACYLCMAV